jgi:hypothetical protein
MTRSTSVAPSAPRSAWKWFLALEACLALVYGSFGIPPHRPFIFGFLPWMEWPGQVPAWSLLGLSAVAAVVYGAICPMPRWPGGSWVPAYCS